jgi:hypothetical protein
VLWKQFNGDIEVLKEKEKNDLFAEKFEEFSNVIP